MSDTTLDILLELIKKPSVTPEDCGCQDYIANFLEKLGFTIEHLPFGDVKNLWATHGQSGPIFAFAGHTDVVPPGDLTHWDTSPFQPTQVGDKLYGRGTADMKGAIAAMLTATKQFIEATPSHPGQLAFLITSDEEGNPPLMLWVLSKKLLHSNHHSSNRPFHICRATPV